MFHISDTKKSTLYNLFNPIYILLFLLSVLISLGIVNSYSKVSALKYSEMNIGESSASYLYYKALSGCITTHKMSKEAINNWTIDDQDANGLNWFAKSISVDINDGALTNPGSVGGVYNGTELTKVDKTFNCRAPNNTWLKPALDAWGYSSGIEALCAFGLKRRTVSSGATGKPGEVITPGKEVDCLSTPADGKTEFYSDNNANINLDSFQSAIRSKVYGDNKATAGVFSDPIKFHIYRRAFYNSCLGATTGQADITTIGKPPAPYTGTGTVGADNPKLFNVTDVDEQGNVKKNTMYEGVLNGSDTVWFYSDITRDWTGKTCYELANEFSAIAPAYSDKLKQNLTNDKIAKESFDTPATVSDGEKPTCGAQMKLLGWIICPIIEGLAGLNDMMFKLIESLLTVNPLTQDATDNTYIAWGSMRNLANAAFVIAFLIIIFSQMSGAGITNYGIKKLLPKLIVCAILVNLSYLIMQVLVDIANIAGSSIYSILKSLTPDISKLSWVALFNLSILGTLGSAGLLIGATTVGAATMIWLLLPIIIMGTLAFIAAFATLVFRQAAIPILAILSPLAFVAYLLPNTESWFKKWKDTFTSMLVLYPTAALLFGGCYFVSHSMIGDGSDWWKLMMGLVVMALPLFSLPFIAKQGGAILSKVSGALSGAADKFKKPVGNWSSKNAERASEVSKNRAMNSNKPSFRRTYLRRQARLDGIKKSQSDSFNRAQAGYVASEAENNPDYLNKLAAGGGAGARDQALANAKSINAKITADEVTAQTALIKDISAPDREKLTMGGEVDLKNAAGAVIGKLNSNTNSALRTAAMKMSIDMNDTETINKLLDQSAEVDASGNAVMNMETRTSLGNILMESGGTPTYVGKSTAAQIKEGVGAGNSADIITANINKDVYSADKIASGSDTDLQAVANVLATGKASATSASRSKPDNITVEALGKLRKSIDTVKTDPTYSGRLSKQQKQVDLLDSIIP